MQWHSNFWQYFSWDIISQTSNPFERAQKVSNSEDHFQEEKAQHAPTYEISNNSITISNNNSDATTKNNSSWLSLSIY